MKLVLHAILLLLLSLPVMAEVSVSANKPLYNFGDVIKTSYTVSADSDFSGLTRLSLVCSNFGLEFHTLLTDMLSGQSQTVEVPGLRVVPDMGGKCYIDAGVSSFDNTILYTDSSATFNVTGDMHVSVTFERDKVKPSEELVVSGIVRKSHLSSSSVKLSFLGEYYASPVINNLFAYRLRLPSGIKTGRHVMGFFVNDSYGNSGEASAAFFVDAVPNVLSVDVGNGIAKPGNVIEVLVELMDQAGEEMSRAAELSFLGKSGEVILYGSDTTPASFELKLNQLLPPGAYTVKAASAGLETNATIVIERVESLSVSFDNRTLTVVNDGNVDYSRDLLVTLVGTKKLLSLSKGVELAPGQATFIDLYKEVAEDDYAISVPGVSNVSFDAHLEDERSTVKKASDFVETTSRVVQETGVPGIQTILSPLILVVVIFVLIFFFTRNRGNRGKSSSGSSDYDAELAALRHYDEKRHDRQEKEAIHPEVGAPVPSKEPEPDNTGVANFMKKM